MNRYLLFTIVLFVLLVPDGLAQRFSGGGFAGFSASQISGDALSGFNKPGLYLGTFASLRTSERKAWQFEIAYIDKGSRKLARPDIGDFYSYRLGLNYISTSLLFRYDWKTNVVLETGPAFGVLIGSKEIVNDGSSASRLDLGDRFDNWELAWHFGAVYEFRQTPWSINLRYTNSVIPVRPHASGAAYLLNFGQYSEVLTLSFCYRIRPQD
jgi:hypothetical protein